MTLRQAISVLSRRWLLVLIATLLALVAAAAYLSRQTPSYSSTATVQLAVPQASGSGPPPTVDPQLQLITGSAVNAAAVSQLKLPPSTNLTGAISAVNDPTTNILSISSTAPSAQGAQQLANAFADAYVSVRASAAQKTLTDLKDRQQAAAEQVARLSKQANSQPNNALLQAQLQGAQNDYSDVTSQINTATANLEPASVLAQAQPGTRVGTSPKIVLVVAAVAGLLVGCGVAFIREQFDTRLRSVEQVEDVSGSVVLAELPYVRRYRRNTLELPVLYQPQTPFAEAVRDLRTSAQVLLADVSTPVLVVTSSTPDEGKTLLAANLAVSWALSGKRAVLVSGDMRRARLDQFFDGMLNAKGLAELLEAPDVAESDVAAMLLMTQIDGLRVLPAGSARESPADSLANVGMSTIIRYLRTLSDVVIIDTPPVLPVTDGAVIASAGDGAIVVVRANRTKRDMVQDTVKRLRTAGARVLGITLNGAKVKKSSSAYRDYYSSEQRMSNGSTLSEPGRPDPHAVAIVPAPAHRGRLASLFARFWRPAGR